jgi:fumarate hydratase class II
MPEAVIRAFGIVKKAAAAVNVTYDLNVASSNAIQQAADEVSNEGCEEKTSGRLTVSLDALGSCWSP